MTKYLKSNKDKRDFIDANLDSPSISEQCRLLSLSRSSYYYESKSKSEFSKQEEEAMKIIDNTHLRHLSYGARSHRENLGRHGIYLSRYKVARLMEHLKLKSSAPQPKTSIPNKKAKCAPYLLNDVQINHINQVWSSDITYIPLGKKHVYLSVVIDWYSRFVVGWRLHETLDAHECVLCMQSTINRYGIPAILSTDQGATYTSKEFCECLLSHNIRQSMDGVKRWADNIIIERWFRNLKHEQIYQSEYTNIYELKELIKEYVELYNYDRLHSSLDYHTPAEWYFSGLNNREDKNQNYDNTNCYNKCVA